MRRVLVAVLMLLVELVSLGAVRADTVSMLGEAVAAYRQAMDASEQDARQAGFEKAYRLFRQVADESGSASADLYVNIGNAALLSAQRGEAILAYRRALQLDPANTRAKQNLEHARAQLPDWVPRPQGQSMLDTFLGWGHMLSPSGRSQGAMVCFAVAALLVALSIRLRWPAGRTAALLPLVIWAFLTGSMLWGRLAPGEAVEAVVTAEQVVARAADSPGAPSRFAEPLPAGTEVRILQRRDGFSYIRLADERDAWVLSSALTSLGPIDR